MMISKSSSSARKQKVPRSYSSSNEIPLMRTASDVTKRGDGENSTKKGSRNSLSSEQELTIRKNRDVSELPCYQ
jgi:hypothetical protein